MPSLAPAEPEATADLRFETLPPLAVYVHIPWCVRKCPYCDFNSHEARGELPQKDYVRALIADLEHAVPSISGRRVHTVFFGGGTPSLFSPESIDAILCAVRSRMPLAADAEVTLEANPGTFEAGKFAAFRALGVNRLSVGIQSLVPRLLRSLGRVHDEAEARRAAQIACANFDNFNLDLMYGLPGQTLDEAEYDIRAAIALAPPHLSAYHLTIEPNTYFHRHPPPLPDDDASAAMQERIEVLLAEAGYLHYETSAFAKVGSEARHNLNYWRFGDYLGIGAGAHSKLSFPDRVIRQMRAKHPREYMEKAASGSPIQSAHEVAAVQLQFEFMMNALRLTEGFPLKLYEQRTGLASSRVIPTLARAEALGLVVRDGEQVQPTLRGQRFLNDLLQLFMD